MKRTTITVLGGVLLMALAPVNAVARADVHVQVGIPLPFYVEPPPVYYEPRTTYYHDYDYYPPPVYYGPRFGYRDRDDHDNGRHRGHRHGRHDQGRDDNRNNRR